ncbi:MAG TPA: hypothetical protein VMZ53_17205 [Kofleriaceae bacterium]|nr:hypothetical protein [Kofleriaceae bacterium]
MRNAIQTSSLLLVIATVVACTAAPPPAPSLTVTSPERGMLQNSAGPVMVKGTALPGDDGAAVTSVKVNGTRASVGADGSFSVVVDAPPGALLLETVATSSEGGTVTDARAVQTGEVRAVGTSVERGVTATLSAEAFARLATAAGPIVKSTDFNKLLAPMQPMANLGDSLANVKLSITKLTLGDVKFTLVPTDGGLQFSAELTGLSVAAKADYAGTFVPDGSTSVNASADTVSISGTLVVTPAGTAGFTAKLASPTVRTTNLKLQASGLVGDVLSVLQSNLSSTIQRIATTSTEKAIQPLLINALGALAGPQSLDVLGKKIELQVSPSAVTFSRAGALVAMNVAVKIAGSEGSPGYVFTPNGTPKLDVSTGVQLALADDLVNEMLAEVHALGLLDLRIQEDFGIFDEAHFRLALPPMISANNEDGTMRLVIGDMIASFSNHGTPVIGAAVNAQVDVAVEQGTADEEIALKFGKIRVFVNPLDKDANMDDVENAELKLAATAGIGVQLDSMKQFLVKLPVPAIAGIQLDNLSLHADSGYVVASGAIR